MSGKDKPRKLYVATTSFAANVDGKDVSYAPDSGYIYEGDPVLKLYPHLFAEVEHPDSA